jgi:hypothetical protein
MRVYTKTVNMSQKELKDWVKNPRNMLASIDTGHDSMRRLAKGEHAKNPEFARKVDNFNTRHGLSTNLFGKEVGGSGWSKRAIALRNWGHDPSKPDSPLYKADKRWLAEHPGSAERRRGRVKNPLVITEVEVPSKFISFLEEFEPFMAAGVGGRDLDIYKTDEDRHLLYYPGSDLVYNENKAIIPVGGAIFGVGIMRDYIDHPEEVRQHGENVASNFIQGLQDSEPDMEQHEVELCQLCPAISAGVQNKYPHPGRTPNPPLSQWIMPAAQLLLSASGFAVSTVELLEIFGAKNKKKT